MPALKEGCKEYDPDYNPKFIFIIATKRHNKRFFAIAPDGRADSLEPGSVIDSGAVRQDVPEFFMQSHYPLQVRLLKVEFFLFMPKVRIFLWLQERDCHYL